MDALLETSEIALFLQSILWTVLNIITIVICIILVYKKRTLSFILMLIGSILSLIFKILDPLLMVTLSDSPSEIITLRSYLGFIFSIGNIIFIVGLGLFAFKPKKSAA